MRIPSPENTLPRTTKRDEMEATRDGQGPLGGERVIEHSIFLTDAFDLVQTALSLMGNVPGPSDQIDGFQNDDCYRSSRHLLNNRKSTDNILSESSYGNLRENSLARQLQQKKDQPATIRLIHRTRPEKIKPKNPSEPRVPWVNLIPPNTKFFLESVQENREEKVQIVDTFGQWVAFFYGRKPEVYSYNGTLLNAQNHDWKNEFQENYDHFLRGTMAVANQATIILQYDDVMVEGYMLNSTIAMSAMADKAVQFSFNMLVIARSPIDPRGIIGLRVLRSGSTVEGGLEEQLLNDLNAQLDLTQEGAIEDLETFVLMREYFAGNYVPGAGTSINYPVTGVQGTTNSSQPGVVGGITNVAPKSGFFAPTTTDQLQAAAAQIAATSTPATGTGYTMFDYIPD